MYFSFLNLTLECCVLCLLSFICIECFFVQTIYLCSLPFLSSMHTSLFYFILNRSYRVYSFTHSVNGKLLQLRLYVWLLLASGIQCGRGYLGSMCHMHDGCGMTLVFFSWPYLSMFFINRVVAWPLCYTKNYFIIWERYTSAMFVFWYDLRTSLCNTLMLCPNL